MTYNHGSLQNGASATVGVGSDSSNSSNTHRSERLQDKNNERITGSPFGSTDGTKYYSFSQRDPSIDDNNNNVNNVDSKRKRPTATNGGDLRKRRTAGNNNNNDDVFSSRDTVASEDAVAVRTPSQEASARKMGRTLTPAERLAQEYVPDPAQFDVHGRAWGYLQALVPEYPSGYLERQTYSAEKRTGYLIGRGQGSDFPCQRVEISKQHCLIYMESGTDGVQRGISVYLEDLSSNGTWVNGNLVGRGKRVLLRSGDRIQLMRKINFDDDHVKNRFYRIILPPQFEVGTFHEEYQVRHVLGRGNFAQVYRATHKETKKELAVKVISKSKFDRRPKMLPSVIQEVSILMSLEAHPCVIQIGKVYNEPKYLYLLLEYVRGGELFDYVVERGRLSEDETRFVFFQLFTAIDFLHSKGIAHRDLKPENVLLVDKETLHVKITDFGLAKIQKGATAFVSQCGTPNYVAPEILDPAGKRAYGKECDLWSLGVMLYICLCGFPPFNDDLAPPPMKEQIKNGLYAFPSPHWDGISREAIQLVRRLLTVDPTQRITVKEALDHPWMMMEPEKITRKCNDVELGFEMMLLAHQELAGDDVRETQPVVPSVPTQES